jgi:DNA polymerase-3 subunit delta'
VVDGADHLNRNAANGLLKVLEEPPPRAILLLVCSAAGRLLPTIRSRCRRLPLTPLRFPDMETLLADYLPERTQENRSRLAGLAEGSPGRALSLAAGGGNFADLVDGVLEDIDTLSFDRANQVADAVNRQEDGFSDFMDLLCAAIATAVRDVARGRPDPGQLRLVGLRPLDAWVDLWHALTRLQDETESAYLDKRQAIVTGLGLLSSR